MDATGETGIAAATNSCEKGPTDAFWTRHELFHLVFPTSSDCSIGPVRDRVIFVALAKLSATVALLFAAFSEVRASIQAPVAISIAAMTPHMSLPRYPARAFEENIH